MKPFQITRNAILVVIEGLILDYDRTHHYRLQVAEQSQDWTEDLSLGTAGLGLEEAACEECLRRVLQFFDIPDVDINHQALAIAPFGHWLDLVEQHLGRRMLTFCFRPAGIDENELPCLQRADILYQDAAAAASLLRGRRRVVSLVSPHSLLGFILTVMTPQLLHIDMLSARHLSPEELQSSLEFGDVIIGTPSVWTYLIREGLRAPDNAMGVSFGEVMLPELAVDMRRNGIGVLRELYGSTQTGLVAWRDSPNDRFVLFEHWLRHLDDLERYQPDGNTCSVAPMDHLDWNGDRTFALAGRRDGAVQIGAINVFPAKIADVIQRHEMVEACTIRTSSVGQSTNRLIADIQLTNKLAASERIAREIDGWCRSHLAVHERPHIYNLLEE